jgi:hypothetical protein
MRSAKVSGDREAGPIVQTIFVLGIFSPSADQDQAEVHDVGESGAGHQQIAERPEEMVD